MTSSVLSPTAKTVRDESIKGTALANNLTGIVRRAMTIASDYLSKEQLKILPTMGAASGGASALTGVHSIVTGLIRASEATDNVGLLLDGGLTVLAGVASTGNGVNTVLSHADVASTLGITGAKTVLSASTIYLGLVAFGISLVNSIAGLIESYKFRQEVNKHLEKTEPNVLEALKWLQTQLNDENKSRFGRQTTSDGMKFIKEHEESIKQLIRSMAEAQQEDPLVDPQGKIKLLEQYSKQASTILAEVDRVNHQRNTSRLIVAVASILGIVASVLTLTGIGAAITIPTLLIIVAILRISADIPTIAGAISNATFQNHWASKIGADDQLNIEEWVEVGEVIVPVVAQENLGDDYVMIKPFGWVEQVRKQSFPASYEQ